MRSKTRQAGFSLLETVVAIAVLSFGVLSLALVFSQGVMHLSTVQANLIAKEKAAETIESVFTARDTRALQWAQIHNQVNGGIFLDGPQPMNVPGADGLVNTVDDGAVETVTMPGPDNILGNADDEIVPLATFTREILITDLGPNLRQIQVIIRYPVGNLQLNYTLTSYISSFA